MMKKGVPLVIVQLELVGDLQRGSFFEMRQCPEPSNAVKPAYRQVILASLQPGPRRIFEISQE